MNDEMKVKRDTRTDLERNLEHFEQVLNVIEEQILYARDLGRAILKSIPNKDIKMTADEAKQALKAGKKVKSVRWPNDDFIRMVVVDSFGTKFEISIFEDFKDDKWEEVKE